MDCNSTLEIIFGVVVAVATISEALAQTDRFKSNSVCQAIAAGARQCLTILLSRWKRQ